MLFGIAGCIFWAALVFRDWRMRETNLELWLDRGKGRRKLVPPVLWETQLSPFTSTQKVVGASRLDWQSLQVRTEPGFGRSRYSSRPVIAFFYQPLSASLSRTYLSQAAHVLVPAVGLSDSVDPSTRPLHNSSQSSSTDSHARSNTISCPRPRSTMSLIHPFKNSTDTVKVAVMICMPHPAYPCRTGGEDPPSRSGRLDDAQREYQIGITQVPWTSSA